MSFIVYGERYTTAEMTGTSIYQGIKMNKNVFLRGMRTWVILFNDPTLTSLNMKIYSDNSSNQPGKLIATSSNSILKSEMLTGSNTYAAREIYFTFNDVSLNANTTYHFVLNGSGYTSAGGSTDPHVAWMRAWPIPVYKPNGLFDWADFFTSGFAITGFIASEL